MFYPVAHVKFLVLSYQGKTRVPEYPCFFLQLMALLLLRHTLSISDNEGNDDDASTMFSVSVVATIIFPYDISVGALD